MSFVKDAFGGTGQGATNDKLTTLLGQDADVPPVTMPTGKKPKAKSQTSTFLGADATPATSARTTLLGGG